MAIYLDGIQQQDDSIIEFVAISSGTVNVGTNQYSQTATIPKPTKLYRNYLLVVTNKSGQTLATVETWGITKEANKPLPNLPTGASIRLKSTAISPSTPNNTSGAIDMTSEEPNPFTIGDAKFQFNLAAAPTSGTIDWALIGY
jgi:hypothetical protein